MDFSYSEEQQMLLDSVSRFITNRYDFDTRQKILQRDEGFDPQNWRMFAELGWLTVPFREEDGGFGASAVDLMVVMEEFGKGMVVEPYVPTAVLAGGMVSELGSESVKGELLGPLMEGDLQLALAYAEAGSRYNPANVTTRAEKDGDGYVITGDKILVFNAPSADHIIVVARTAGESCDEQGISAFLVSAGAQGMRQRRYPTVDGHRAAEVHLDGVRVPASALLGEEGAALPALQRVIDRAALAAAAEGLGAMDCLLKKTVEYARTRKQFNTPIGTFQALQHRMAEMFIECQLSRSIVTMAAMTLDSDESEAGKQKSVSAAKSRVGRALRRVGQEAVQIHGGIGMTDELDVGHYFKRVTTLEKLFGDTPFHTQRYALLSRT
ncbi:MAG: acyl-CoA dehydrogenase family protein [Pseudohongiellaceae bacterium]